MMLMIFFFFPLTMPAYAAAGWAAAVPENSGLWDSCGQNAIADVMKC
jgi:hypothetical protein